jgi:hypothetical protein
MFLCTQRRGISVNGTNVTIPGSRSCSVPPASTFDGTSQRYSETFLPRCLKSGHMTTRAWLYLATQMPPLGSYPVCAPAGDQWVCVPPTIPHDGGFGQSSIFVALHSCLGAQPRGLLRQFERDRVMAGEISQHLRTSWRPTLRSENVHACPDAESAHIKSSENKRP